MTPAIAACLFALGTLGQDPPQEYENFSWEPGPRVDVAYQGADSLRAVGIT